jgi:hypothetical protein
MSAIGLEKLDAELGAEVAVAVLPAAVEVSLAVDRAVLKDVLVVVKLFGFAEEDDMITLLVDDADRRLPEAVADEIAAEDKAPLDDAAVPPVTEKGP